MVVLEFYHTMKSRGVPSPLEIGFSIDDRPGELRATDITAALSLPVVLANSNDYRRLPQPSQREMVGCLARDTTAGPILFRRKLPPHMLMVDHVLRTSLFLLLNYVQHRGAILKALQRISEGFWFSPSELVMTSLLHFEEKVHHKDMAGAEAFPLLIPRLLSHVLEHLGFPEEPRIEWRIICFQVLSTERSLYMPLSIILQQQENAVDDIVEDPPRGEHLVPEVEVEVERTPVPDSSHPVPPPTAPAPTDTAGPSIQHSSHQSISMSVPGS